MKRLIEEEGSALEALMGETVTFMCVNYFYTGKLAGVNETCVAIQNPKIIYETGLWSDEGWKRAESLPCKELYIQLSKIESYGVLK